MAASKGTKDFYKVLNVKPTASRGEIKDAYRKLALALHPDRNEGCDVKADQFKSINEAYDTLADHGKRTEYDGSLNGRYNRNRRQPPPPDYRKVYSPRPPPGFKTFDERRHFDMHYGDGMAREEISDARRRYEAASERFGRSRERDEGYQSPLGRGFTFDGYGKTHGGNPYSKMPQGPSQANTFRVDYEEGHYYDLGSTNLNQARRVVSHKESVRERMSERRKNRVRNRGDPKYEEASGCAVM